MSCTLDEEKLHFCVHCPSWVVACASWDVASHYSQSTLPSWCLLWSLFALPHIQMSAVIAEPELEGRALPFSHTYPVRVQSDRNPKSFSCWPCILFRLYSSLFPSVCLPVYQRAWLKTPPHSVCLHQHPHMLVCLIGCMSVGLHERVC